jgi:hypothetical protein
MKEEVKTQVELMETANDDSNSNNEFVELFEETKPTVR